MLEASKRFRFRTFLALARERDLRVRTIRIERLHTIAFDTAGRILQTLGASVSYRAFGGWTLSVPCEPGPQSGSRIERSYAGPPQQPPVALLDALASVLAGEPLVPIAEVRAIRQRVRILGKSHNDALELAAEDVRMARNGKYERSEHRLVLELLDPANEALFESAARLLREAGAKPAAQAESARMRKRATAAEAVALRLSAAFDEFCRAELRLRLLYDVESVHVARVALRRLRASLRVFSPMLAPVWTRAVLARAARLAEVFGRTRDADVIVANVTTASERLGEAERAASLDLLAPLLEARLCARRELSAFMNSPEYREIVRELRAAIAAPQFRARAARPARKLVPKLVTCAWKRLRRDVRALKEQPTDAALHRVRIRAKRCRYAAEALIPLAGKRARRFARTLGELQDQLGRIQDAVLERQSLLPFTQNARSFAVTNAIGAMIAADVEAARREWRRAWKAVRRSRRRLA
jgi:CHAD domain-containing protein